VAAEGAEQLSQSLNGELKVPTLILWASDDSHLPVENAALFRDAIPNARIQIFPGLGDSGGQPLLNHPEAPQLAGKVFNEVLVKFLNE
jgi:pimeloyl-ACP methyl ester carboxylesterase